AAFVRDCSGSEGPPDRFSERTGNPLDEVRGDRVGCNRTDEPRVTLGPGGALYGLEKGERGALALCGQPRQQARREGAIERGHRAHQRLQVPDAVRKPATTARASAPHPASLRTSGA